MIKSLSTIKEIANIVKANNHQIPFKKYLFDALVNRFNFAISRFVSGGYDPSFFEDVNGGAILRDFEEMHGKSNVSNFWSHLANYFFAHCNPKSFRNFKRTVNRRFFCYPSNNNPAYLEQYYQKVKEKDELKLLSLIEEPDMGNPTYVQLGGNPFITQDLIRSIDEFYAVYPNLKNRKEWNVCEIGAGYGRLAFVYSRAAEILDIEHFNYFIFDIPPVIFIGSKYFSCIRDHLRGVDVEFYSKSAFQGNSVSNSKGRLVRFCLPAQMEELPDGHLDTVINIASFAEMDQATVNQYFNLMDLKLKRSGVFYTKQVGKNAEDVSQYAFAELKHYPYKPYWVKIVDRVTEPPFCFEAVFRNEKT